MVVLLLLVLIQLESVQSSCLEEPLRIDPFAEKVVISINFWNASALNAHIAKILMEEAIGIPTELVVIDENEQWEKISDGSIHACLENWPSGHVKDYQQYIMKQKTVLVAGPLGVLGQIGWYTQEFVLKINPATAVSFSYTFDSVTEIFNHTLYVGDPSWVGYDDIIIAEYNYSLTKVALGGEEQILERLKQAMEKNPQEPILFYFWSPHGVFAEYNLFRVALPRKVEDLYYPPDILTKIVHYRLQDISPSGSFFVNGFSLRSQDQIDMLFETMQGVPIEEVACRWVKNNSLIWSNWIKPLPNLVAYVSWSSVTGIIPIVMSLIVILICIIFFVLVLTNSSHPSIFSAGYLLLELILFGAMLMAATGISLMGYASMASCSLSIFFFGTGFSITWGCVLLKEYRIWAIYKQAKIMKKKVKSYSDKKMTKYLSVIVIVELIIDILWITVTPPQTVYGYCSTPSSVILSIYIFYKAVLLILACLMAIKTRKMSTRFSESKSLSVGIYAFTVLLAIVLALTVFLSVVGCVFAMALGVNVALLSFLVPVFLPKIYTALTVDPKMLRSSSIQRSATTEISGTNGTGGNRGSSAGSGGGTVGRMRASSVVGTGSGGGGSVASGGGGGGSVASFGVGDSTVVICNM